jgi:AcrR family transcriptional regulator
MFSMLNSVHMSALSRRRKQKEELRRLILDAARDIFVHQGYEGFSLRKLAEKIEYSPASVYLHFKSKEALFERLVEESFERLLKTLTSLRKGQEQESPVEELKKAMRAYVEFGLRNPNDYRLAFTLRPPVEKRPYKVHGSFDVLRFMVKRCVKERCFRAVDVETTAQALWASVHGITSLLIQRPAFPWVPKKALIAQVISAAVDSQTTRPRATRSIRTASCKHP